jgi:curved DNA-binding protein
MRLKGRGLPGKPPGDQYVVLEIAVPSELSAEQKKLFEHMREVISFDPRSHLKGGSHD